MNYILLEAGGKITLEDSSGSVLLELQPTPPVVTPPLYADATHTMNRGMMRG